MWYHLAIAEFSQIKKGKMIVDSQLRAFSYKSNILNETSVRKSGLPRNKSIRVSRGNNPDTNIAIHALTVLSAKLPPVSLCNQTYS